MPESLRILFVAPFGLAHKTTVWARTLPLAKELRALGHHANILAPPWDSPEDAGVDMTIDGVTVHNLPIGGGLPAITVRLLRSIDQAKPDIVHVVKPRAYAGIAQWALWQRRRFRPAPAIFLDIDDWEQPWAAINGYPWHVARFLAWQEEWGIRHADGITAASRWLTECATGVSPSIPVEYLPNGVDTGDAAQRRPTHSTGDTPAVLWFTRFVETSPQWMAAFWHALRNQLPAAKLLVAGQALQEGKEDAFRAALADPQVEWIGYVERERLPDLFASATCAVFPSEETPLLQAKCSVRMATALQYGVPVVAGAVGEQAAYGAEGAALLIPPDAAPDEFARRVAGLLESPDEQAALSAAAQSRMASRYAWPRLGAQLEQFYMDVLRHAD